ncbi:sugar O-acetyltransferase [Vibrio cholerae]|uniref:sugar O-acetyltransferase n=1 Tax=Vibrio cholerae TaxID=666 RepID=UPI00226F25D7|nr:sugar O-acetyltransferase [Vibrio cholerae]EJL6343541.1 sugar O-acetyltransferase [Vibrio cholerae]ELF6478294.1 sugar O-acetyltransferase [Vibrio cholerae]MCX9546354.1 sugar O-acetyltransferase [Vibrio cholerae]MCX9553341.1 sugar O-acetyltransferase [Vibrio cholerae]HDL9432207.1 sugar O-acetyltransferase [Vibrio cholerae]
MTEREKMLSGEYYDPSDAELVKLRLEARLLTEKLNQTSVSCPDKRVEIIKSLLGSTGNSIHIESTFNCDYGLNIHVGENFYANFGCVILDVAEVRIGDNCFIAPQVGIYTATHPIDPIQRNSGLEFGKPIRIGNNCWIGGHATINPGVTLGDNIVVASGAVVTKSFGSNVVIGGNPARVLKAIE